MWVAYRGVVVALAPLIAVWFVTDLMALAFDWVKYRRFASYHAYSAKLAGVLLFAAIFTLFVFRPVYSLLTLALTMSIVCHIERIIITAILPKWTPDVLSVWHAIKHRRQSAAGTS